MRAIGMGVSRFLDSGRLLGLAALLHGKFFSLCPFNETFLRFSLVNFHDIGLKLRFIPNAPLLVPARRYGLSVELGNWDFAFFNLLVHCLYWSFIIGTFWGSWRFREQCSWSSVSCLYLLPSFFAFAKRRCTVGKADACRPLLRTWRSQHLPVPLRRFRSTIDLFL